MSFPDQPAIGQLAITLRRGAERDGVQLSGELDSYTAGQLRARLDDLVRHRPHDVDVDLADVTFIDAAGVAALLNADAHLHASGARLVVTSPTKLAARVLRAAGAADLLVER